MLNDHYEYSIASHFASPLINGDYSGLNKDDTHVLNQFLEFLDQNLMLGTWVIEDDEPSFDWCEISIQHANCVTAKLYFHNKALEETPMLTPTSSNEDIRAFYYNFQKTQGLTAICVATNLTPEEVNLIIDSED